MKNRRVLAGIIVVFVLVLGGVLVASAGSEVPAAWAVMSSAGSPINNNWGSNNPAVKRFVIMAEFSNAAVLDKNIGLVWERPLCPTERIC